MGFRFLSGCTINTKSIENRHQPHQGFFMNFPRISTRRLMLSLLVLFGLGMQVACGGSSSSDSCTSRDDCARDEVCRDGACAPPASDGVCADASARRGSSERTGRRAPPVTEMQHVRVRL